MNSADLGRTRIFSAAELSKNISSFLETGKIQEMRTLLRSTVNDPNSAAYFNTSQLHYLAIRLEMLCSRGALCGPVALLPQLENPVGRAISDSRTANAS